MWLYQNRRPNTGTCWSRFVYFSNCFFKLIFFEPGRIGTAVALRAKAFGFNVIFYDPNINDGIDVSLGITRIFSLDELLSRSNCVSLHCTSSAQNFHLINEYTIRYMKNGNKLLLLLLSLYFLIHFNFFYRSLFNQYCS